MRGLYGMELLHRLDPDPLTASLVVPIAVTGLGKIYFDDNNHRRTYPNRLLARRLRSRIQYIAPVIHCKYDYLYAKHSNAGRGAGFPRSRVWASDKPVGVMTHFILLRWTSVCFESNQLIHRVSALAATWLINRGFKGRPFTPTFR